MADIRRSGILGASLSYWLWLGKLPGEWAQQLGRRRRSWFVFGGCFAWLFMIVFVGLAYLLLAAMVVGTLALFAVVGCLLSLVGLADQLRLQIVDRNRIAPGATKPPDPLEGRAASHS